MDKPSEDPEGKINAGQAILASISTAAGVASLFTLPRAIAAIAVGLFVLVFVHTLQWGRKVGALVAVACLIVAALFWADDRDTPNSGSDDSYKNTIQRVNEQLAELRKLVEQSRAEGNGFRQALENTRTAILTDLNRRRSLRNASPLELDSHLTKAAQRWSAKIAGRNTIAHPLDLLKAVGPGWDSVSQGVAKGPNWQALVPHLLKTEPSPPALRLNTTHVGIGLTIGAGEDVFMVLYLAEAAE